MSAPVRGPDPTPLLDAEDALRGVVHQLAINDKRIPVIIPGSVIDAMRLLAGLLRDAQGATYLPELLRRVMPWTEPLTEDDLSQFAAELVEAASGGDRAPERLAAALRAWQATAEILGNPQATAELAESAKEIDRGDVVRGPDAVRALRPRP